jgi:hypothetical protein
MAADYAVYDDIMKEVWTQDRLEKQFYDQNLLLDAIEKTSKYKVGRVAKVPVHLERSGGYSVVPEAGAGLAESDQNMLEVPRLVADYLLAINKVPEVSCIICM